MRRAPKLDTKTTVSILSAQLVLLAFLVVGGLTLKGALGFSEPPAGTVAPANNTPGPLNTGTTAQSKNGNLNINETVNADLLKDFNDPTASIDFINGVAKFKGDLNLGGNQLVNAIKPTENQDIATKKYVDDNAAAAGF